MERKLVVVPPYERKKEPGEQKLPEPKIFTVSKGTEPALWAQFGWDEKSVGRVVIETAEGSGIYVSVDNHQLTKALRTKKLSHDVVQPVQDRYVAGIAFYLLLRKVHEMKGKTAPEQEPNGSNDASTEWIAWHRSCLCFVCP